MRSCFALPFVENESIATFGSIPTILLALSAAATATSASWFSSGSGMTAQSLKIIAGASVTVFPSGGTMTKQLETDLMPGAGLMT